MSAAVKTAVVNQALGIAHLFEQNCALKHGLPEKPQKQVVGEIPADPSPQVIVNNNMPAAAAAQESPSPGATVAAAAKSSLLRRAAPWLIGAMGGAGIPLGAWMLSSDEATPPTAESPADKDGSLLQWLQDKGFHRPEGPWQTNQ